MPNANRDGFEARIFVIKTDAAFAYRILLTSSSDDFDETSSQQFRTPLAAFRAGHEKLYTEVLGVLTGG